MSNPLADMVEIAFGSTKPVEGVYVITINGQGVKLSSGEMAWETYEEAVEALQKHFGTRLEWGMNRDKVIGRLIEWGRVEILRLEFGITNEHYTNPYGRKA